MDQKSFDSIYVPGTEKAMAPHSSTLAWKIPWLEEPGRLWSMGSQRVGHNWATSLSLSRHSLDRTLQWLPGASRGLGPHIILHCHNYSLWPELSVWLELPTIRDRAALIAVPPAPNRVTAWHACWTEVDWMIRQCIENVNSWCNPTRLRRKIAY